MNNCEGEAGVMAARAVEISRGIQEIEANQGDEPSDTLRKIMELEALCRQGLSPRDTERFQRSLGELRQRFRVKRQGRFRMDRSGTEGAAGVTSTSTESAQQHNSYSDSSNLHNSHNHTPPSITQEPELLSVLTKSKMPEPPQDLSLPTPKRFVSSGTDHNGASDTLFLLFTSSSIHIRDSHNCTIVASCHQLRLSNCTSCKVYASCPRVAIESSSQLEIGYIAGQPHWEGVDDFSWLKGGTNPHWRQGGEISADQVVQLRSLCE